LQIRNKQQLQNWHTDLSAHITQTDPKSRKPKSHNRSNPSLNSTANHKDLNFSQKTKNPDAEFRQKTKQRKHRSKELTKQSSSIVKIYFFLETM
jgi:hypothetical protein